MSFPRVPRISRSYLARNLAYLLLLLPLSLLLGGGMAYMGAVEARQILVDTNVWANGQPIEDAEVTGEETSRKFVFHEYDLSVAYVSASGPRTVPMEFNTIGGEVDTAVPVEVRTDAQGRVVTSYQIETKASRWAYAITFVGFALFLFGFVVVEGIRVTRLLRIVRAMDDRTPVVAARIVKSVAANTNAPAGKRTHKIEVAPITVPGAVPPSAAMAASLVREQDGGPFYVDAQAGVVLVAVHERWPAHPIVLAANGAPFDFAPEELAATAQKVSSRG